VIGLDTNVLVRYLAADDPAQTRPAARIIEDARQREEPLFLRVLERSYHQRKEMIISILEQILAADLFVVERDDLVRRRRFCRLSDWQHRSGGWVFRDGHV
jgi:predicted nucleic-acid-binding protein